MIDWTKHASLIKRLTFIPFVVGLLGFVELALPSKTIQTKVLSKKESFRAKTGSTTYTIEFEGINDQFTEEIYSHLNENQEVEITYTPFHKQIESIKTTNPEVELVNDTGENYAVLGFSFAFVLAGLLFFTKKTPKNWQLKAAAILTIFSLITGFRMFI